MVEIISGYISELNVSFLVYFSRTGFWTLQLSGQSLRRYRFNVKNLQIFYSFRWRFLHDVALSALYLLVSKKCVLT